MGKGAALHAGGVESGINLDMSHVVPDEETELFEGAAEEKPRKRTFDDEQEVEEEDEKPQQKEPSEAKPRGRAGAWIGGTVLGAVIGTAACLGAYVAGIDPPASLRTMAGTAPSAASKPGPGVASGAPAVGAAAAGSALDHIKQGNLEKVTPADLARMDETKPEQLVARAEYHWLNYLKSERSKNAQGVFNADAEPVKKALADLDKAVAANNPDALFLRGQIHELTGKTAEAKKDYEKGVQQFKDNAAVRARFETALLAMELAKVARLAPADAPRLLALMLTTLQAAVGEGPPGARPCPKRQAIASGWPSSWREAASGPRPSRRWTRRGRATIRGGFSCRASRKTR